MSLQKETKATALQSAGTKSKIIDLRNRQRVCRLDLRLLRRMTRLLLQEYFQAKEFELGVHLVEAPEMTQLNEKFLRHAGSTDVITFDYTEQPERYSPSPYGMGRGPGEGELAGEIFICITEAQFQARRYRTELASEIVRYLIHGLLHLRGYDDKTAALRRKMKREEDRLLLQVAQRCSLKELARL